MCAERLECCESSIWLSCRFLSSRVFHVVSCHLPSTDDTRRINIYHPVATLGRQRRDNPTRRSRTLLVATTGSLEKLMQSPNAWQGRQPSRNNTFTLALSETSTSSHRRSNDQSKHRFHPIETSRKISIKAIVYFYSNDSFLWNLCDIPFVRLRSIRFDSRVQKNEM